jgi:hypothetical protein
MTDAEDPIFEKLMNVFRRTDAKGSYVFSDDDVKHFLPWILVHMDVDLGSLDDVTIGTFAEACAAAGVKDGMDVEQVTAAFDAWYAKNPPNPELAAAFSTVWRETTQDAATPSARGLARPRAVRPAEGRAPRG